MSARTMCGETALHVAAHEGWPAVVRLLAAHGADVSARDSEGATPLHYASDAHEEVVRALLDKGADVAATASNGMTPEDVATFRRRVRIAAVLAVEPARRAKAARRVRCEAFAMGHQARLGAGSWVCQLDAGVVRMVLEQL